MSVKKIGADSTSPFNYILCLDIIVAVCIVIVAGRPDGMAITVSAVVVAVCAIVYRCTMGVMGYLDAKARKAQTHARAAALARQRERDAATAKRTAPVEPPFSTRSRSRARRNSWLSDED